MPSGDVDAKTMGPWDRGLDTLRGWDPKWAESCVLKLCVVQGVQACNLGVPILAEELARHSGRDPQP